MKAETREKLHAAIWNIPVKKIPMERAYTYCIARINGGMSRCNNRCQIGDDFCVSCTALRAAPKVNTSVSVKSDGEKGTALPSTSVGVTAPESPRKGKWYDALGANIAEKLIRDAHGLKCSNCGEPIGLLSDATTDYGWVHYPEGRSYTYCFPEQNQIDLKAAPIADEVETD